MNTIQNARHPDTALRFTSRFWCLLSRGDMQVKIDPRVGKIPMVTHKLILIGSLWRVPFATDERGWTAGLPVASSSERARCVHAPEWVKART